MNGTHLMVIALGAAALLGLHADAGSLFLFMASAAQTFSPGFAGYADLPGVRLWYTDSGGNRVAGILLHTKTSKGDSWLKNNSAFGGTGYRGITFELPGSGRRRAQPTTEVEPGS